MKPGQAENLLDVEQLVALADLDDPGEAVGYLAWLHDQFAGDARQSLERMRELSRRGDALMLAREAHRLKGSSGSLGAARFSLDCLEIECRARSAGVVGVNELIDAAQRRLGATVGALRDLAGMSAG